jgi:hypothetical protein
MFLFNCFLRYERRLSVHEHFGRQEWRSKELQALAQEFRKVPVLPCARMACARAERAAQERSGIGAAARPFLASFGQLLVKRSRRAGAGSLRVRPWPHEKFLTDAGQAEPRKE